MVGEEETVECPECGKECEGREVLKQHMAQADNHPSSNFDGGYLGKDQIHREIANSSSFEKTTVKCLITVANIPEQFEPFVKTKEERNDAENELVEETVREGFTFVNEGSENFSDPFLSER